MKPRGYDLRPLTIGELLDHAVTRLNARTGRGNIFQSTE
jgi:hypothetical protein